MRRDLARLRLPGGMAGWPDDTTFPRPRSAAVFDGPDRAAARAYMKGIGYDDDALRRPTIGIANTWTEAMPCNYHLRDLAGPIKEGVRAAGGTPMEFNTVAISDGITMGTKGMKASLVSREVIADSIELMARGYQFDALVALAACDKTIPGAVMALARLDIPSVLLYGGSIAPGRWNGKDVTIVDVFEAIGAHAAGNMTDEELRSLEDVASPGRRRLRRAVHRQHHGLRVRGARDLARRRGDGAGRGRREGDRRRAGGRARDAGARRRPAPEQGDHEGGARERDRLRLRLRAAPPTSSCTCSRSPARPGWTSTSTTSSGSRARRRCLPTSSPAGATSPPTSTGPAACR